MLQPTVYTYPCQCVHCLNKLISLAFFVIMLNTLVSVHMRWRGAVCTCVMLFCSIVCDPVMGDNEAMVSSEWCSVYDLIYKCSRVY